MKRPSPWIVLTVVVVSPAAGRAQAPTRPPAALYLMDLRRLEPPKKAGNAVDFLVYGLSVHGQVNGKMSPAVLRQARSHQEFYLDYFLNIPEPLSTRTLVKRTHTVTWPVGRYAGQPLNLYSSDSYGRPANQKGLTEFTSMPISLALGRESRVTVVLRVAVTIRGVTKQSATTLTLTH